MGDKMAETRYTQELYGRAFALHDSGKTWNEIATELSRQVGWKVNPDTLRKTFKYGEGTLTTKEPVQKDLASQLLEVLNKGKITFLQARERFGVANDQIEQAISQLRQEGFNVYIDKPHIELRKVIPSGDKRRFDIAKLYGGDWYRFGFITDNHLGSKYERLDVLNAGYDHYAQEGVQVVYNAGNVIDGFCRLNKFDLLPGLEGYTAQVEYFVKNYPQRDGIITYFITGDDHEGWWVKDVGINIGEYMQLKAEQAGRHDLKWIGHVEADVILEAPKGQTIIRVIHPGGGSSYAYSYRPQKIVESYQGGEKPHILLMGHYHKLDCNNIRNVWVVQGGCTEDQTVFMRKKSLEAHVGYSICEFQQCEDGTIHRFRWEGVRFFDRGYYQSNNHYKMW